MRIYTLPLTLLVLATACGDDQGKTKSPVDPIVHTHSADATGIFVNGYIVETEHHLIAIDTMLTVSDAERFRKAIDQLDKPLAAVLITHGHPDHYNGTTEIVRNLSVPIIATEAVYNVIATDDDVKATQWTPVFGDEWPSIRTFPTQLVEDNASVSFDGVTFTVHGLEEGESHHDTYWVMSTSTGRHAAFIGDTVFNGMHAYMSDGHSAAWLTNLDILETALVDVPTLYPGHGAPGDHQLLDVQRDYLTLYRATVARLMTDQTPLTETAKQELVETMMAHQPSDRLAFLIELGADPIARELSAEGS